MHFLVVAVVLSLGSLAVTNVAGQSPNVAIAATKAASSLLSAPICTKEQEEAHKATYDWAQLTSCWVVRAGYFQWCDDECLAQFQRAADAAPSCTSTGADTLKKSYDYDLKRCLDVRANTTGKYIPPRAAAGTANCTLEQIYDWERDFFDAADKCDDTTLDTGKCSDECLKVIETSVNQAPKCKRKSYPLSMREDAKDLLVNCLQTRGDDLWTNAVLQSGEATGRNRTNSTNSPTINRVNSTTSTANSADNSSSSGAQLTPAPKARSMAAAFSPLTLMTTMTTGVVVVISLLP